MNGFVLHFSKLIVGIFFSAAFSFNSINQEVPKPLDSIRPWNAKTSFVYSGVYKFGDSEWESELRLVFDLGNWYGQVVAGEWSEGDSLYWVTNYENLTNLRIEGNKFYSDKANGEFICYWEEDKLVRGLKVYNSWTGGSGAEIGVRNVILPQTYPGVYPQTSTGSLYSDWLKKLSKKKLKIMRNEIYARYGYQFRSGGKMDLYFRKQNWYQPQHKNVDNFLTDLEKKNIKLIQSFE